MFATSCMILIEKHALEQSETWKLYKEHFLKTAGEYELLKECIIGIEQWYIQEKERERSHI